MLKTIKHFIYIITLSVVLTGCHINNSLLNNNVVKDTFDSYGLTGSVTNLQNIDSKKLQLIKKKSTLSLNMKSSKIDEFTKIRLQTFLDKQDTAKNLTIRISIKDNKKNPHYKALYNFFKGYGVPHKKIKIDINVKQNKDITITATHYRIFVKDCPNFSNVSRQMNSNFGCATTNNFAVQLSNPEDALRGRELAPISSAIRVKQLELYYTGQIDLLKNTSSVVKKQKELTTTGIPSKTPIATPTPPKAGGTDKDKGDKEEKPKEKPDKKDSPTGGDDDDGDGDGDGD